MENYTNSYYFYANYSNDRNFKDTHTLDTFPYYSNLILTFEKWRVNIDPVSPSYHSTYLITYNLHIKEYLH